MRSQRQLMVGEELRHALAAVFLRGDVPWPREVMAPRFVTVTEVQVSPDLKNATAFVVLRDRPEQSMDDGQEALRALNEISGFFRKSLADMVRLRYMPKLSFRADNSFDYAQNISRLLSVPDVAKDLKE